MQTRSHEPHPLLLTCAGSPPFYEMWNTHAQIENGFQQIRKFLIYTVASEITKIHFSKDHACKKKELFHTKTKENAYAIL